MGLVRQGDFMGEVALSHRVKEAGWAMFWIKRVQHCRLASAATGALMPWVWSRTSVETATWP